MKQTLDQEINKSKHYNKHESGIETIEIIRHLPGDLANAWKYAMRYEDKDTPEKDILKLCYYLKDFKEHFIDINNLCTTTIDVPIDVRKKMLLVIETEPQKEIQATFEQIYSIVVCGGLLFPKTYDKVITDLEAFAKTLN